MKKRIIITGAAGRIGQAFILAHRDTYDITGFDRKPTPNVDRSVTGNLTDLDALVGAAQGCIAMIHLGAHPNQHLDYPGMIVTNNIVGSFHAYEAAARAGIKRVVFASTVQTEFGWPEGTKVSVTMPARPTNVYSSSKVFGEHLGFLVARDRGVSVICLRFGGVVPPEQEEALLDAGETPADIALFSSDVVEIMRRSIEVEHVPFAVLPAYSINAAAIKDLEPLRQVLGFTPVLHPRLAAPRTDGPNGPRPARQAIRDVLAAAAQGDLAAVTAALTSDPRLTDVAGRGPDWEDRKVRPLHMAAGHGHLDLVRFLLAAGADPTATGGRQQWTPVQYAAIGRHGSTVELLLAHGALRDVFVESALGDVDRLRARLAGDPAAVKAVTPTGVTPLHVAGSPDAVRVLLDHGADPAARDDWRRTPLGWSLGKPEVARALAERTGALNIFFAASVGDAALATSLLDADAALANAETPAEGQFWPGRRSLHLAVMRGHVPVIRVLLAHGANLNALDADGATALHVAAWHGRDEVIRLLVESGAKLRAGDTEWSATPKDWAEHAGRTETVKLLAELEAAHPEAAASATDGPIRRILLTGAETAAGKAFRAAATEYNIITTEGADPGELERLMAGCDAVVHLGGAPQDADFSTLLDGDILRLWVLLEAARKAGVRRFVFGSTMEVVTGWSKGGAAAWPGDPQGHPGAKEVAASTAPLRPGSLWAAVKALNENICIAYGKRLGMPPVSVRISGENDAEALLKALDMRKETREGNKGQQ